MLADLVTARMRENVDVSTMMLGGLTGKRVVSVSVGYMHGAAVTSDGELYMWGFGLDLRTLCKGALSEEHILEVLPAAR